ncbi:hypothetical protein F4818DRAFT_246243 [Hypoxylon cercidicola]|nr:hypothetical protein F4818DRAFT_246243 [Hypoxylon cercidicola]
MASADDGCFSFASAHSIPTSALYEWNPVLGSDGAACTTAFWASEYYCISVWASTTSPTSVTAPGPTQTGIVATCDKFAETQSGDGCESFAARNNITPAQLYEWNSVLGVDGTNCDTMLWGEEWYCVGVSGSSSTTTTTTPTSTVQTSTSTVVTAPGETQTGIVSNCNKFAEATPGQGCSDFTTANSITASQLYTWNTVLGRNGENCGTMLWGNECYCVGVSI